ncbi:MAG: type III-B CRISPR module-associated protein Cmr5 [Thermoguttaceae bacterium]
MPDTQPTREQQRARHALDKVKKVAAREDKFTKEYKRYAKSLAATIVVNGLGQACATLLAQAKGDHDAHRELYDHLEDWLCGDHAAVYEKKPLVEAIINGDQDQYVRAQFEALAYLTWLKKFAQAHPSKDKGGADGTK